VAELTSIAGHCQSPDEAVALMKISALLKAELEKIRRHADEVKTARIVRGKAE